MTGRFSNVRPLETTSVEPERPAEKPALSRPPARPGKITVPDAPPALRAAPERDTFSVRVRRELADEFNAVVKRYKKQGWAVSNGAVLEQFFEMMQDPEYAQDFMLQLAEKRALERAGE